MILSKPLIWNTSLMEGEREHTPELAGFTLELASYEKDNPEACAADVGEVFHVQEEGIGIAAEDGFEGILELLGIAAIDAARGSGDEDRSLVFSLDLQILGIDSNPSSASLLTGSFHGPPLLIDDCADLKKTALGRA